MGIVTDVYFVEGAIESIKALGVNAKQFYIRDANGFENFDSAGYGAMRDRNNVDIQLGAKYPRCHWVMFPKAFGLIVFLIYGQSIRRIVGC